MVKVRVSPGARVPSEQGIPAGQSPVLLTKVVPEGSAALTSTATASDGPLFVTVTL